MRLVVSELYIPCTEGACVVTALKQERARLPRLRVLAHSRHTGPADDAWALAAGVMACSTSRGRPHRSCARCADSKAWTNTSLAAPARATSSAPVTRPRSARPPYPEPVTFVQRVGDAWLHWSVVEEWTPVRCPARTRRCASSSRARAASAASGTTPSTGAPSTTTSSRGSVGIVRVSTYPATHMGASAMTSRSMVWAARIHNREPLRRCVAEGVIGATTVTLGSLGEDLQFARRKVAPSSG